MLVKGGAAMPVEKLEGNKTRSVHPGMGTGVVFDDLKVVGSAGAEFSLEFTMATDQPDAVQTDSAEFYILAYALQTFSGDPLSSPAQVTGVQGDFVTDVTIKAVDEAGLLLDGMVASDNATVKALLKRGTDVLPYCEDPPVQSQLCLAGGSVQSVVGGLAEFTDLVILGGAGSDFSILFEHSLNGPAIATSGFTVFPGSLAVRTGALVFPGSALLVVDKPLDLYRMRLQSPTTGAASESVVASDNFVILAELYRGGVRVTDTALGGNKSKVAAWDPSTQVKVRVEIRTDQT